MNEQGVHPDGGEGTSDAAARPDTADPETERSAGGATGTRSPAPDDDCAEDPYTDEVEGDEPLLPARVHRPPDLMRLLVGLLAIGVLLAVAAFAHGTTSGLEQDINKGTGQAP